MALNVIDVNLMRAMFIAGAQKLEDNKEMINMLNVFPVPDGDTGTNMSMTLQGAVREIAALPENASKEQVCKAISSGSLRGARGNSGVILSQILRGFIKNIRDEERPLEAPVLAVAMAKATETAYKAVMKPKEGTILTVVKAMSDKALELTETDGEDESIVKEYDLVSLFKQVIDAGYETLQKTPEMLPVLKEAGVVDSGGEGLMCFMSGMYEAIPGIFAGQIPTVTSLPKQPAAAKEPVIPKEHIRKPISTDDIKFGYCTEFLVLTKGEVPIETENEFKAYLATIGDSIVCVSDEDIIKVHVHTNDPGLAIQKGLTYGMLSNLKIDNMRLEHQNTLVTQAELEKASDEAQEPVEELQKAPEPAVEPAPEPEPVVEEKAASEPLEKPVDESAEEEKGPGFVAVVSGAGLAKIFKDMGVDVVIEGGQTMNPSTDDIMCAIESIQADPIYILPNNKNIIMSANQARDLTEDRTVYVIPTKTIPQGITAMISHDPSLDPQDNAASMAESASYTKSLEITYAVRSTKISGHKIKKGDIMGLDDDGIKASGHDLNDVALRLLDSNIDEDSCVVSVFAGCDTKKEDAEALVARISESYPSVDVDLYDGGQPLYYYLFAID